MRCSSVVGGSAAALWLGIAAAAPHKHRAPDYVVSKQRADAVKEAFQFSWDGYYRHAFPHDSLRPATNRYADDRWGLPLQIFGRWVVIDDDF